ncbi:tail fiber domain-containing protein [Paraflavitalea sp. CAU 1676]|uniref:tail fiber domain-containing protein n=1 Tax=Paraflavitalea sp. CAU 1676 TaxID=3032598 RepID=UPI0023DA5780|nr:tail fiber domain-containing protein [Paraflavitalea sp. CAU 1676]MDF2187989.1 hypothetical protein [Paraflavitalea sp. CAU 1676]
MIATSTPASAIACNGNKSAAFTKLRNYRWAVLVLFTLLNCATPATAQVPDTLVAMRDATLTTRLSLHVNGGLYVGGAYNASPTTNIVAEGAGTRMLWYPEKAAFRAGDVTGTQWDDANIGWWSVAMGQDTRASGDNSFAAGKLCQAVQASSFAMGEQNTASGAASVALGYHSHTNARQGSFVFGDRSTVDTIRAGVNHSANWRVSGGFRIFTSSNLSTGVTLQSGASVSNWGQASAVISTSTGALLTTGGVWQNASDVSRKHLFEEITGEEILGKLRQLPIRRWSYRAEANDIRHIGPTSQDFYAAFQLGSDEKSIGTVDADGVSLVSIQALEARTRSQAIDLQQMKADNEALRGRLEVLEIQVGRSRAGIPITIALIACAIFLLIVLLRRRIA